jgi:phage gp45-like
MIRRIGMIRGIITAVTGAAGKLARFSATGRVGETIENREIMQQYGVASRPPAGAECMILKEGNHFVMIASDDRRYRLALQEGEVALYTEQKGIDGSQEYVHLKKTGIEVHSNSSVKVMAPLVKLGKRAMIDTAMGVVTQQCVCSITGAVHPQGSLNVAATLGP